MAMLGMLTGKTEVKCIDCKNLINGECYGKKIPDFAFEVARKCGFWKSE